MKRSWALSAVVLTLSVVGCDEEALEKGRGKTATTQATTAAAPTPPKTVEPSYPDGTSAKDCEQYVAALERCVKQMPEEARAPMQKQLDKQRKALEAASEPEKRSMAPGCRMGLKSLEQNAACKK